MKKALYLLLALVLMLAAAACEAPKPLVSPSGETEQPEQPPVSEDIQMSVKEQTVAGDAESITLTITNASDKDYTYGAMWTLEAEKNGVWEEVKPLDTMMWIEIAYVISPGQTNEDELTLKDDYGTLKSGNYRIVKTFTDPDGNGSTAYGAFTVK